MQHGQLSSTSRAQAPLHHRQGRRVTREVAPGPTPVGRPGLSIASQAVSSALTRTAPRDDLFSRIDQASHPKPPCCHTPAPHHPEIAQRRRAAV
eukprot:71875-Prymnesium_polylepis.1